MISFTVDDRSLRTRMRKLGIDAMDGTIPLLQLHAAVMAQMAIEVNRNANATGGIVRGEEWEGFAPQYTRKDGTVVPAWGGIPKTRGRGMVKGRLRPSGQRVSRASKLLRDTGRLFQAILNSPARIIGKRLLLIGTNLPVYAEKVLLGPPRRNPLRWVLPRDQSTFDKIAKAYLDRIAREASKT